MNDTLNPRMTLLDRLIGLPQRIQIGRICRDIFRSGPQVLHPIDFGLNRGIQPAASDPDDLCFVGANHIFTPYFADIPGAADYDVHASGLVQCSWGRFGAKRNQLPFKPLPVPVSEQLAVTTRRQSKHRTDRPNTLFFHIHDANLPSRILFGHRTGQTVHTGMGGRDGFMLIYSLRLNRNQTPTEVPPSVTKTEKSFHDPKNFHHTVILLNQQSVIGQGIRQIIISHPYNMIDVTVGSQLFCNFFDFV
ncbi:hypothetical protein D3C73_409400 [compost metagenome]